MNNVQTLEKAIKRLKDKMMIDHEYMDADDLGDLTTTIKGLEQMKEEYSLYTIAADDNYSDDTKRMLCQTEMVKQLLNYCAFQHGAKITIVVEHDQGHKATAELYDHAALVQSLYESLEYFQSEF